MELIFLSLPSADMAVARVATRVRQGGHDIPEPVIGRRFEAGARNFGDVYRFLVDEWRVYDNSGSEPVLVGGGRMSDCEAREGSPDLAHPVFADPLPALRRAAERARRIAIQTNTPLVRARDGQVVFVAPGDEIGLSGMDRTDP